MCSALCYEHVDLCVPITGLKEVELSKKRLILQAQGPYTLLLEVNDGKLLSKTRTFRRQEIHGFVIKNNPSSVKRPESAIEIIAWGGHSVRSLRIESREAPTLVPASAEFNTPDRILDACSSYDNAAYDAFFVTGHNAVLGLQLTAAHQDLYSYNVKIWPLATSVKSTLYSADIVSLSAGHVLVAAGTVFGDIVVWSCFKQINQDAYHTYSMSIHHFFSGHEGSIFGVDISPEIPDLYNGQPGRLLASCSDDRTVRIWDISDCGHVSPSQPAAYSTDGFELRKTGFTLEKSQIKAAESSLTKSWGHESRIWAVKFLFPQKSTKQQVSILSRGEDSTCQFWKLAWDSSRFRTTFDLQNITTLHSHAKKNIWSWDISERDDNITIYTGGADGALRRFSLVSDLESPPDHEDQDFQNGNLELLPAIVYKTERAKVNMTYSMKAFEFISEQEVLAVTTSGKALIGQVSRGNQYPSLEDLLMQWTEIFESESLRLCHLVSASTSHSVALIGNTDGMILLYSHRSKCLYELTRVATRPLRLFIVAQKSLVGETADDPTTISILVTYPASQLAELYMVHNIHHASDVRIERIIKVNLPTTFQVSCATLFAAGRTLIVGGKMGGVAVYDMRLRLDENIVQYGLCERREHGKETVHVISQIAALANIDAVTEYVLTCGRDGCYCVHELKSFEDSKKQPVFKTIHRSACSTDMAINGAYMDPVKNDIIFYGFRTTRFILWNESTQTDLMSFDCGGSKRKWAFQPSFHNIGAGTYLWVRAKAFNVLSTRTVYHQPVLIGGHGRELKAIAITNSCAGKLGGPVIATAAEDSDVRIYQLSLRATDRQRDPGRVLHDHISGPRQVTWAKDGRYLFTSAGNEQFFVWRVFSIPLFGFTVLREASSPKDEEISDLRVTSFDLMQVDSSSQEDCFLIALAYSNSTVKIFLYTPPQGDTGGFVLLARGTYITHCIFQLQMIQADKCIYLLSGTTDGYMAIWNLDDVLVPIISCKDQETPILNYSTMELAVTSGTITWRQRYSLHQSSIKALDLVKISTNCTLVITGGDDNALAVSMLDCGSESFHLNTISIPDAHASSINTIKILHIGKAQHDPLSTLEFVVCSCGNDHRLKIWSVAVDTRKKGAEALDITQKMDIYTPVADISCMDTFDFKDDMKLDGDGLTDHEKDVKTIGLVLGGVGVEILRLKIKLNGV